jgi:hypothetical protein
MTFRDKIARPRLGPICLLLVVMGVCRGEVTGVDLFEGFRPGWRDAWSERGFPFTAATRYTVETDVALGRPVLHAEADDANRALLRPMKLDAPTKLKLSWRWKIAGALPAKVSEREKRGDDYAARIFVVFETGLGPIGTVAINYVWAASEAEGATYASPYSSRVRVIVLRSGAREAGVWRAESRDAWQDYRDAFGREPRQLNGIAVMVDTDNTGARAEAWFEELRAEIEPALPSS